jgi:hypothetical protein
MSETPKAKTTAKKPATKKAVIADSTNADKPVKAVRKAPAKKTVTDTPVAKKAPTRRATPKVTGTPEVPAVAWVEIPGTVARKSFWAKLKAFFTGK